MTIYTRDNGQWDPREAIGVNLSPTVQEILAAQDRQDILEVLDLDAIDGGTPESSGDEILDGGTP